jgi:hypothetical protein
VIESRTPRSFRAAFASLSEEIQVRARRAYHLFREDPGHPSLRFKKVAELENIYSLRIGLGYRALGVLDGSVIIWFWIGSHDAYDHLMSPPCMEPGIGPKRVYSAASPRFAPT